MHSLWVFMCFYVYKPACLESPLENDVFWVEFSCVVLRPIIFMLYLFVFPGWRQWVRAKSLCWVTQTRRSSHPQSPLWTSVWTTRPWTPVWSVTARRLTTTMWCATPPHRCSLPLRPRRIWLTAWRPLLCSPLFWLISGLFRSKRLRGKVSLLKCSEMNHESSRPYLLHLPTSRASAVQQKETCRLIPPQFSDVGVCAARPFHIHCDLSSRWKQAQVFLSSTVKTKLQWFQLKLHDDEE